VIKLLSYNIEWGKRLPEAGQWIMTLSPRPDIFCLQEIPNRRVNSFRKVLEEYGYSYKFAPSFTKKGVTYGQLTAYNAAKYSIVLTQIVDLGSSLISRLVSGHNSKWRSLITVLQYKKRNFIIVNIHLLPHALNGRRRKQLEIAIEALKLLNFLNVPTLIVGDYNYSSLVAKRGLISFMAKHGFKNAHRKKIITHSKWRIKHQTDYVFLRNCKVINVESEKIKFSDHYPLHVDFEI